MSIEHHRGVVVLALIAAFMVFVDSTIVNLALAPLASHLDASRSDLEWAVNAYTFSFAAVMLSAGAITDTLRAKQAFVAGLLAKYGGGLNKPAVAPTDSRSTSATFLFSICSESQS
jgi:MFS transporter, DHA2 family, methylenomycin A resistance protein